jgi:hypothetical protein
MPIPHEVQARIQADVLMKQWADWVKAHDEPMSYETFLHKTKILEPRDAERTKLQRLVRTAFEQRMVHELFADWANGQIANGRDARECVFGAFVEENDLLVRNGQDDGKGTHTPPP